MTRTKLLVGLVLCMALVACGNDDDDKDSTKADSGTSTFTCAQALLCSASCTDLATAQTCVANCANKITTANGKTAFTNLTTCANTACPTTSTCTDPASQTCQGCWSSSFQGACKTQSGACSTDA